MNILGKPVCITSFLKNDCERYSTKEENEERRKKQLKNWLYRGTANISFERPGLP